MQMACSQCMREWAAWWRVVVRGDGAQAPHACKLLVTHNRHTMPDTRARRNHQCSSSESSANAVAGAPGLVPSPCRGTAARQSKGCLPSCAQQGAPHAGRVWAGSCSRAGAQQQQQRRRQQQQGKQLRACSSAHAPRKTAASHNRRGTISSSRWLTGITGCAVAPTDTTPGPAAGKAHAKRRRGRQALVARPRLLHAPGADLALHAAAVVI